MSRACPEEAQDRAASALGATTDPDEDDQPPIVTLKRDGAPPLRLRARMVACFESDADRQHPWNVRLKGYRRPRQGFAFAAEETDASRTTDQQPSSPLANRTAGTATDFAALADQIEEWVESVATANHASTKEAIEPKTAETGRTAKPSRSGRTNRVPDTDRIPRAQQAPTSIDIANRLSRRFHATRRRQDRALLASALLATLYHEEMDV